MNKSFTNHHPNTDHQILNYRIIETIYSGSRTLVYRAIRTSDRLPVTIKLLKNPYPNFNELVQFRNQYTITKNLRSSSIVQTYSLEPYQNSYALVMEDFGGISLKNYVQKVNFQFLKEFLDIAIAICNALEVLYRQRVIHKDIKPTNILINPQTKEVKLIDFSIASLLPRETQTILNPNHLEGTLAYISPEQTGRMNRGIDYRTDFYSLGVTFYELLAGELPFPANEPMELVHCHIAKQPKLVHEINSEIPVVISEIVAKLMAKNAETRYQSALGLKWDLERCWQQLQAKGKIEAFPIAQRDLCDRFIIPDKLYGRETEVEILLQAFDRVSQGATEMMLVAGFSGIGKTAVVNEVHKPIVRQRGYFIKGKFDQFQRNIPFSAFVQAFRDLMGQLFSESDAQIQQWKQQILEVLGENARVIIEVIPELESIIGPQPAVVELSGTAAQNRFNLLFQKFTQVFTRVEHPLAIFLDDLQWADLASLNLMQLLMADTGYLFIIGAYRDNEVYPGHPLMLTLSDIAKSRSTINTITLAPLSQAQVNQLIADTLKTSEDIAGNLSVLIYQKTKGNPFFTTQFLKALYQDIMIQFDFELGCWQCDIAQIRTQAVTDDVVAFMSSQLRKLQPSTQQILQLAACIGNSFDLATLAIVSEQSQIETAACLWKALQEGFIVPIGDFYKFYVCQETTKTTSENQETVTYKFLHDRVQQAAYALIPDRQKQATHYQIGQLLLQQVSPDAREERIFEIVNQLNYGTSLISEQTQRNELARLNLTACRKARTATAYQAAREYAKVGLSLLGENAWQQQYEMSLAFHELAAEVAMLCGDFEAMEKSIDIVTEQAHSLLEQVNVYRIRIQGKVSKMQFNEVLGIGINLLQQLGITMTESPTMVDIQQSIQEISELIGDQKVEDFADLPVMTDANKIAITQIASSIMATAYSCGSLLYPLLTTLVVKLSLRHGNISVSATNYACYSLVLSNIQKDIDLAAQFGQLALHLALKFDDKALKPEVFLLLGGYILHRNYHIKETLFFLKDGYTVGLEIGNLEYAGYCVQTLCRNAFYCGQPLADLEQNTRNYYHALVQLKQLGSANSSLIYWQAILNLLGFAEHPTIFSSSALQETEFLPMLRSANDWHGLYMFYSYKLMLSFLFGEIEPANNYAFECRNYFMSGAGTVAEPAFYFYDSFVALALLSQPSSEGSTILERVAENQTKLQHWANYAPMNHQHKVDLVEAEKCRVLGQKSTAIELYDKAIWGAKENKYIQEEALANELAAKFYLDWDKEKIAQIYMQEAYYCYARWGAKAKIADLEKRYPTLLVPILHQVRSPFTPNETITVANTIGSSQTSTHRSIASTSGGVLSALDLTTILKASQTLSSEIELEKLLCTLLHMAIENAGADKCALLLHKEGKLLIEAMMSLGQTANLLRSLPLEDSREVPISLINTVKRTLQPTAIANAIEHSLLLADPYIIRQQPKSLLCMPILHQSKLLGVLYLENKLATGAFTSDRVEVLHLICAQAAISLDNARLYQQSQTYGKKLEQSLEKLHLSEARFQKLTDNVPGMIYQLRLAADGSVSIPYVSSGCYHLYEVTVEEIVGGKYHLRSMEHPDDRADIERGMMQSAQDLTPFQHEWRIVAKSGKIKWVQGRAQPERQADGSILWDGILVEISDRKAAEAERQQAENALRQSEERYRSLTAATSQIIWITDAEGRNSDMPMWGAYTGQSAEEINEWGWLQAIHPDDRHHTNLMWNRAVETKSWYETEYRLRGADGRYRYVVARAVPILKEDGSIREWIGTCTDINDRKRAEVQLQQKAKELENALQELQQAQLHLIQSEKMSALGNLVSGVAHEINNPVGFLSGNIQSALDYIKDVFELLDLYQRKYDDRDWEIQALIDAIDLDYIREDLPKSIGSMQEGVNRIREISTSLRIFSRADKNYTVPFNIHDGIDSTILILKHRLKATDRHPAIEIIKEYGNLPQIQCFPGQLNQVFMNILANAIDALEEANHGRSLAQIKASPNRIRIRTEIIPNNCVKVCIADNGIGMTPEVKRQIFDHLFTTKAVGKGTGLGLAIARQIVVEKHGGAIEVNSAPGQGTEFEITLPSGK